jgi:hypothetical protein
MITTMNFAEWCSNFKCRAQYMYLLRKKMKTHLCHLITLRGKIKEYGEANEAG